MKKIAFVCQRYGKEVNGGSEAECRMLAEHLCGLYDVTVYTTCAKSYITWKNEYAPGTEQIGGVTVRRFPNARSRSARRFRKLTGAAFGDSARPEALQQQWVEEQGPYCPALLEALWRDREEYAAVFFMTYLYYPTAVGLTMPFENAFLIPTAHDEPPIRFRFYDSVFAGALGYLWQTEEEKAFAERRFPFLRGRPGAVGAVGIEVPAHPQAVPAAVRGFPYILYAGRIDESKGCGELFGAFLHYKERCGGDLKLVLIGKEAMRVPSHPDIVPLGFVSEETKYAVMRGAEALVLFSRFESLSIVVLESMALGRPVLVNGRCEVLRGHCVRSGAGLYFGSGREFAAQLDYLRTHRGVYEKMCANGPKYVRENYTWEVVRSNVSGLVNSLAPRA